MYFSWKFYLFSISHIILEWYWRVWLFPWLLRFTAILLFLLSVTLVWSEVTFFNVQPVLSIFAQMIRSASKGYYYFYVEVSLFWKKLADVKIKYFFAFSLFTVELRKSWTVWFTSTCSTVYWVSSRVADGSTRQRQLADVLNRVETSASWSSIQYNLLEVKHIEK